MALDVNTVREAAKNPYHTIDLIEAEIDRELWGRPEALLKSCYVKLSRSYLITRQQEESLRRRFHLSGWTLDVYYGKESASQGYVHSIQLTPIR